MSGVKLGWTENSQLTDFRRLIVLLNFETKSDDWEKKAVDCRSLELTAVFDYSIGSSPHVLETPNR